MALSDVETEAYQRGRKAALDGKNNGANVYSGSNYSLSLLWQRGFADATSERAFEVRRNEDEFIAALANVLGCDISSLDMLVEIAVRRAKL